MAGLSPVIPPVRNPLVNRRRHSLPRGLAGPGRQVLTASDSDTPNILDAQVLLGRSARAASRPGGEGQLATTTGPRYLGSRAYPAALGMVPECPRRSSNA